jgi:hypothetical protein
MVQQKPARRRFGTRPRGREEVLPRKARGRLRHLDVQRVWKVDCAPPFRELGPMPSRYLFELCPQPIDSRDAGGTRPSVGCDDWPRLSITGNTRIRSDCLSAGIRGDAAAAY